jgi:hypothetical protein
MIEENPPAAGQGGQERAGASDPQSGGAGELRTEDALGKSDEELRRLVAARLAEHVDIGSSLIAHCEHLAGLAKGDRVAPVHAAARLMRADAQVAQAFAQVAQAFAQVAQLERRSRRIVERVQPVVPKNADLNSTFVENTMDQISSLMVRYMKLYADETLGVALKDAAGDDGENDGATKEASAEATL